ncbi:MAG: DUF3108 domain-containing protein [Xanthomonadales bacterium]|nr:DUF3108 domain-containing protein [Xanthomonadales bacterium]
MNRFLPACLFVFAASTTLAAPVAPFKAEYFASRNGKQLGQTTIELIDNRDATWTLRTTTVGTAGLASLVGLDVVEESRLRWTGGHPETLVYDFRQKAALRSKQRHADFDWERRIVHMRDGDHEARYALVDGAVDRHALTIALVADLARGVDPAPYKVAMKDAIEDIRYTDCGQAEVSVPAGRYATRCLERRREKRTSTSWFAARTGWLPVRIEQVEKDGETITLELVSLQR